MCRRTECPKCGRPTFAGCGMHIEQVLGDVPVDKRCNCLETKQSSVIADRGFMAKYFGRS